MSAPERRLGNGDRAALQSLAAIASLAAAPPLLIAAGVMALCALAFRLFGQRLDRPQIFKPRV